MAVYWLQVIILAVTCFGEAPTTKKPSCPQGKYGVISRDGSVNCFPCSSLMGCPLGMGMSVLVLCGDIISQDTKFHCVDCVSGKTYSSEHDRSLCQPCHSTTCYPNEAFHGKCTVESDTTRCNGICKKGFYPRNGSVEDCQPCSLCLIGQKAKRVSKCVSDGMPTRMQCEITNIIISTVSPTTEDQDQQGGEATDKGTSIDNDETDNENDDGYKFYGHPGMLSASVIVIAFLGTCLLVIVWRKKCKHKKTSVSSGSQSAEGMPLTADPSTATTEDEPCSTGVIVDIKETETDRFDGSKDLPITSAMRRRTNSSSSGGKRKVSFSRQNSNSGSDLAEEVNRKVSFTRQHSNSGSDLTTEENAQAGNFEKDSEAISSSNQSPTGSQVLGKIKRTLSLNSERKVPGFSRQLSNPIPEQKEAKGFSKSRTFGSFSSTRSGQRGTSEETTPFLNAEESDDDVLMMKPSTNNNSPKLTTKTVSISQLNAEVFLVVCRKLNQENYNNDWRVLAGKMGYSNEFVRDLGREKDPTSALLNHWRTKSGNNVTKLIELLKKMDRSDVVRELESEQL